MKRLDGLSTLAGGAAPALLFLAIGWQSTLAAPAPLDRSQTRVRPLCPDDLVGTWTLVWAGQSGTMTLSPHGEYVCTMGGLTYVGSWSLDYLGRFCITESPTPHNSHSWRTYAVRLDPRTLAGRVEVGSPGISARLVRLSAPVK